METKIKFVLKYLNIHVACHKRRCGRGGYSGLSMIISAPISLHHQSLNGWATDKLEEKNSFVSPDANF